MDETTPQPTTTSEGAPPTNGANYKDQAVNGNVRAKDPCHQPDEADPKQTRRHESESRLNHLGAANAVNAVKNHPVTQDLANGSQQSNLFQIWHSYISGPMATSVKNQAGVASNEFGNLGAARTAPSYTAANDTPLTRKLDVIVTVDSD